jgi:hypothetical protein
MFNDPSGLVGSGCGCPPNCHSGQVSGSLGGTRDAGNGGTFTPAPAKESSVTRDAFGNTTYGGAAAEAAVMGMQSTMSGANVNITPVSGGGGAGGSGGQTPSIAEPWTGGYDDKKGYWNDIHWLGNTFSPLTKDDLVSLYGTAPIAEASFETFVLEYLGLRSNPADATGFNANGSFPDSYDNIIQVGQRPGVLLAGALYEVKAMGKDGPNRSIRTPISNEKQISNFLQYLQSLPGDVHVVRSLFIVTTGNMFIHKDLINEANARGVNVFQVVPYRLKGGAANHVYLSIYRGVTNTPSAIRANNNYEKLRRNGVGPFLRSGLFSVGMDLP